LAIELRLVVPSGHPPQPTVVEGVEDPSGVLAEDDEPSTLLGREVDAIIWQCGTGLIPRTSETGVSPEAINVVPE
jgi:hypothetical protein